MKLKFQEIKTIQDCFNDALIHIRNAKERGSLAVINPNTAAFRNRVVSYAVLFYIKNNWKKTDLIECEYRAAHYGVAVGTVMNRQVEIGDVNIQTYTKLMKQARSISRTVNATEYC